MSTVKARISNLYDGPFNGSQAKSLLGQTPMFTMDGDMEQPRGRATVTDVLVTGSDVFLFLSLPDGTRAGEIGHDAQAREVSIGYIVESDRSILLHTVARSVAAPRDSDTAAPTQTQEPLPVSPEEVYEADDSTAPEVDAGD